LDLRGGKWLETGADSMTRSFITSMLLPNIIRAIKSRRMKWAGYIAYIGEMITVCSCTNCDKNFEMKVYNPNRRK